MDKVLFFIHMATPIHGVTMCNKVIADSDHISNGFETTVLPIRYGYTISDMQVGSIKTIFVMIESFSFIV